MRRFVALCANSIFGSHLIFILINAFGYGLIIVKASPYLARTLAQLERGMMFLIVVISFIVIGLWAQRNRQI